MSDADAKKTAVASRLRIAREQAGLSQGQVAKLIGLHRPSITEIEAGRRNVTVTELGEFARLYGVNTSWLACDDSGEPNTYRDRVQLAARKLSKLKPEDLESVLELLSALLPAPEDER